VIVYRPKGHAGEALPAVFNMHGGGFVGLDAVIMDSFCRMLSERVPVVVFNVNYKLAPEYAFPYAINEVYDTAAFVAVHASEFSVDPANIAVGGHSAGASIAAGVALKAKEEGAVSFACQFLVYPCTDLFTVPPDISPAEREAHHNFISMYCQHNDSRHCWASPLLAQPEELTCMCPAIFVICGIDDLRLQGEAYAKRLIDCGIPMAIRRFEGALHGFVEVNRPDFWFDDGRKSPEQAELCRKAEDFIVAQLKAFLA
jgi:acetyl esterase